MRKCKCIKECQFEIFDDDGFSTDKCQVVNIGTIFNIVDNPFRLVGDKDTIRLENDTDWLEITPKSFHKYFKEIR